MTLPQAQLMTNEAGKINTIDINVETGAGEARRAEIQKAIEAAIGPDYHVGTLMSGSDMFAALQLGQAVIGLFGLLALFMGGFIIFNTFRTVVAERRRDIGMLRALGATRGTITGMILAEGLLQGIIGSVLGLGLGYLFGAGLLKLVSPMLGKFLNITMGSPVVSPGLIVICVLLGVSVTVLAGLIPARSASRVTPLEALRPSMAETGWLRKIGIGSIIGIAVIVISVLTLRIREQAGHRPGRLSVPGRPGDGGADPDPADHLVLRQVHRVDLCPPRDRRAGAGKSGPPAGAHGGDRFRHDARAGGDRRRRRDGRESLGGDVRRDAQEPGERLPLHPAVHFRLEYQCGRGTGFGGSAARRGGSRRHQHLPVCQYQNQRDRGLASGDRPGGLPESQRIVFHPGQRIRLPGTGRRPRP